MPTSCVCSVCVLSRVQLCPTLCDPMDCSLPGSSVHGISQARILGCIAISSSRGSSQPKDQRPGENQGRCKDGAYILGKEEKTRRGNSTDKVLWWEKCRVLWESLGETPPLTRVRAVEAKGAGRREEVWGGGGWGSRMEVWKPEFVAPRGTEKLPSEAGHNTAEFLGKQGSGGGGNPSIE